MTFGFDIHEYLRTHEAQARADLASYYSPPSGGPSGRFFSGRFFDQLSEESDPLRFGPADVAAVATLSVELEGHAVAELLFTRADQLNGLLAECPPREATLWDVDEAALAESAPLGTLYAELKTLHGVGYVRASKLLACKRPHLIPVRDSFVETLLCAGTEWWGPMRAAFVGTDLVSTIERLTPPEVPSFVSVLRRLDVILWMAGTRAAV